MSVLSHQAITELCGGSDPVIVGASLDQVRSASYDMRVGTEYYVGAAKPDIGDQPADIDGGTTISRLDASDRTIVVPADQVVLIRTAEDLNVPLDLVGHLSLKLDVLLRGLLMASQSQIDAGYRGGVFILLYNLGSSPVCLSADTPLVRLEFEQLDQPTEQGYAGDYKPDFGLANILKQPLASSMSVVNANFRAVNRDWKETKATLERRLFRTQISFAISLAVAVITLITAFMQIQSQYISPFLTGGVKVDEAERVTAELSECLQEARSLFEVPVPSTTAVSTATPCAPPGEGGG
jgi:deoxycytidine triphosphate deaminase